MKIIRGGAGWYWHAIAFGTDIIVRGALATWFGGDSDPQDNGDTASGISTKGNPALVACSLPMRGFPKVHSTYGSPIPRLPWQLPVEVSVPGGKTIIAPVIDIGPSGYTNHPIDLTVAAFQQLGGDLKEGILSVDYRIIGGAKYL